MLKQLSLKDTTRSNIITLLKIFVLFSQLGLTNIGHAADSDPLTSACILKKVITYNVAVVDAFGPHANLFPKGTEMIISYTLDPLAKDSVVDKNAGIFQDSVLSLSATSSSLNLSSLPGAKGLVQTFNDAVDRTSRLSSDQVFIISNNVSPTSLLEGESILSVEVDFLSNFVSLPTKPNMLSSDKLPLFKLPTTNADISIQTASGFTEVVFNSVKSIIKGTAPWGNGQKVTCLNLTTGKRITIPSTNNATWDCESAGLLLNHRDKVRVTIEGVKN